MYIPLILALVAVVIAMVWFGGYQKVENFSPGTVVQVHPSHAKKYEKTRKDHEQLGAGRLGPASPSFVFKETVEGEIPGEDPCFDGFEDPMSIGSLN